MHKNLRTTLGALGALTLVISLSACNSAESSEPSDAANWDGPITIKYSAPVPGALPFLPVDIAIDQGFFEEEGIQLDVTQTSAQALPAALTSGQIDMTADTAYNVARYLESDIDVKFVSGLNDNVDFALVAAKGTEIPAPEGPDGWEESFAALKGKSVGVAAKAGPIGLTVTQLMKEAGVPEGEYTLIDTPGAAAGNALAAGQVDAVISGGGFDAPLIDNGLADPVLSLGADIPNIFGKQTNATLSMTARAIEANPEAPEKVQRAIAKAIDYIQDPANLDSVVDIAIASGTPDSSALVDKISGYDYLATLSVSGLDAAFEWAEAAGISSEVIDAQSAIAEGVKVE